MRFLESALPRVEAFGTAARGGGESAAGGALPALAMAPLAGIGADAKLAAEVFSMYADGDEKGAGGSDAKGGDAKSGDAKDGVDFVDEKGDDAEADAKTDGDAKGGGFDEMGSDAKADAKTDGDAKDGGDDEKGGGVDEKGSDSKAEAKADGDAKDGGFDEKGSDAKGGGSDAKGSDAKGAGALPALLDRGADFSGDIREQRRVLTSELMHLRHGRI